MPVEIVATRLKALPHWKYAVSDYVHCILVREPRKGRWMTVIPAPMVLELGHEAGTRHCQIAKQLHDALSSAETYLKEAHGLDVRLSAEGIGI